MKKLVNNNRGFTLAELVVAGGIATVIGVLAFSSLRTTRQASNITVIGSESSTLKSLIVAQLANPESCQKTFPSSTTPLVTTPVTRLSGVEIRSGMGVVVVKEGLTFGPLKEFSITKISTSSPNLASNILKIRVDYAIRAELDKSGKKAKFFEIEIFVNKDPATRLNVIGCFADVAGAVRRAVEQGCKGQGAVYNAAAGTYGTCTHVLPRIQNATGSTVYTTLCPAGQYLQEVKNDANNVIFTCRPFTVPACTGNSWTYIKELAAGTGQPNCISLSTWFPVGTVFATLSTKPAPIYRPIDLNCGDSNDLVLRSVRTDYSLDCVPKQINQGCPVDQYIQDIIVNSNHTYSLVCKELTKSNSSTACPNGQYLKKVNANGNFPADACGYPVIPATCATNSVMQAIDSAGNAVCTPI